jgi:phosphoribosylaminoimidazole-succinocarboxamide synthase
VQLRFAHEQIVALWHREPGNDCCDRTKMEKMTPLLRTSIPGLPEPRVGKVREVFDLGSELLIVATDRISAFDVVMANGVLDKGRILSQMSAFWFEKLSAICPNHVISVDDLEIAKRCSAPELAGRSTIARKAKPLPIECVARGYISGSLFKEYRKEGRNVHDLDLPEGLVESQKLSEPIFTPATKAEEGHDLNLSWKQAVDIVGTEIASQARDWTLKLYSHAADHAATVGLILADTKFEFGLTDEGLIWIDEALTPDSSRYWEASLYEVGHSQPSFDKQYLRDWLEEIQFNKQPPGPVLPDDVVSNTRAKYVEAYQRITGRSDL